MPEIDRAQLARLQRKLIEDAYGGAALSSGAETSPAPSPSTIEAAEEAPLPADPGSVPAAAAKIAVSATFDAGGVLLESGEKTRRVLFLPKSNRRGDSSAYTDDILVLRRDVTWAILTAPDQESTRKKINELTPTPDSVRRARLSTLLHGWWNGMLRINGRGLVVPLRTSDGPQVSIYVPNPRLDITLQGNPKAKPPES